MKKIVIVDFDLKSAYQLKPILENNNFQVHVVNTIELANSLLKKISPSLVIIDVMMEGEYNGLVLAKQLLKLDKYPYVLISEEISNIDLYKIQKTRPFGFLMKPIRTFDLITTLSIIMNNYSYEAIDIKCKKTIKPKDLDLKVCKIVEYLEDNFREEIKLDDLSKIVGCGSTHLIRIFKKKMKITPHQFLLKLRIEYAIDLIGRNNEQLSINAKKAGFNTYSVFHHLFKKHTGYSPEDYRKLKMYERIHS